MKNIIYIITIFIIVSCESIVPDEIKECLLTDAYSANDSIFFAYKINQSTIDTLTFFVSVNKIDTMPRESGLGSYEYQYYTFKASTEDEKSSIDMLYTTNDNTFLAKIILDTVSFSLNIIEDKIASIDIDRKEYLNITVLRSEYSLNTYSYLSQDLGIVQITNNTITLNNIGLNK